MSSGSLKTPKSLFDKDKQTAPGVPAVSALPGHTPPRTKSDSFYNVSLYIFMRMGVFPEGSAKLQQFSRAFLGFSHLWRGLSTADVRAQVRLQTQYQQVQTCHCPVRCRSHFNCPLTAIGLSDESYGQNTLLPKQNTKALRNSVRKSITFYHSQVLLIACNLVGNNHLSIFSDE